MIRHGADKPTVEIDLGAIGDGKVILCEAKSSSTLANSDPDERRGIAKLITARRRPVPGHHPARMVTPTPGHRPGRMRSRWNQHTLAPRTRCRINRIPPISASG
jgi:hypothetical protein